MGKPSGIQAMLSPVTRRNSFGSTSRTFYNVRRDSGGPLHLELFPVCLPRGPFTYPICSHWLSKATASEGNRDQVESFVEMDALFPYQLLLQSW